MLRTVQTILTVVCGLALVGSLLSLHPWLPLIAVIAGSPFALMAGWEAVKHRQLDVNVLMLLAGAGAVALGHPTEAAVLLFLFSLSSTLEEFAMARTKSAIEGLVKLRPSTAIVVEEGGDRTVPVEQVVPGQIVRVLPFEQIPLDGVVVSGSSEVNQAAMTGESTPISRTANDAVLSGTQNLDGMLVVQVTKAVGDTTLSKIVDLVRDAQENKASGERISQWFGQRYTLFVLLASVVSVVARLAFKQSFDHAMYASLTLLVALSPCALVISTPATTLSALAWAARNGILVRGGEFIELAGQAKAIALDKTGTLTKGTPVLEEICVCGAAPVLVGGNSKCIEELACWSHGETMSDESKTRLRIAAAGEQYSTHPIAEAIVQAARDQGLDIPKAVDQRSVSGHGVTATVDGKAVKIGQARFFDNLPPEFEEHVNDLRALGMTVALLQYGEEFAAFGLRDRPRDEAQRVVAEMRALGFETVTMLTGDNPETALAVAKEVGITDVRSALLPDDKEAAIAELDQRHQGVIFVGDGVNDAPSLARASVGVGMGGLGSDVALNAANVVLMHDNLKRLPSLVKLGRKTNGTVRANLVFASSVITLLTLMTLIFDAWFPAQRHSILPYAVVGHEGSTVLVILNGLRLLRGPRT